MIYHVAGPIASGDWAVRNEEGKTVSAYATEWEALYYAERYTRGQDWSWATSNLPPRPKDALGQWAAPPRESP